MPERERLWFPWRLIHRLEIRMEHVEPLCTSPVIDALTTDCDHVRATASRIAADLRWQDISDEALVGWVGAWAWVHVESRRALPARGILGITGRELEGLYLRLLCSVGIWLAARKVITRPQELGLIAAVWFGSGPRAMQELLRRLDAHAGRVVPLIVLDPDHRHRAGREARERLARMTRWTTRPGGRRVLPNGTVRRLLGTTPSDPAKRQKWEDQAIALIRTQIEETAWRDWAPDRSWWDLFEQAIGGRFDIAHYRIASRLTDHARVLRRQQEREVSFEFLQEQDDPAVAEAPGTPASAAELREAIAAGVTAADLDLLTMSPQRLTAWAWAHGVTLDAARKRQHRIQLALAAHLGRRGF